MKPINTKLSKPDMIQRNMSKCQARDPEAKLAFVTRRLPMKTVMVRGKKLRLYSLSWLARLSVKSPRTFHRWEIEGIFPKPLLDLNDGYRWYTAAEINAYSDLVKAAGMRKGRVKKGNEKMSLWLKRNSFELQRLLRQFMKDRLGDFPDQLAREEETLKTLAGARHLKLPPKEFLALITGG